VIRRLSRRAFISGLAALAAGPAVVFEPPRAHAQQPRRIGVLMVAFSLESKAAKEFRLGLRDAGYAEGRDVVIEWRSANGDYNRIPQLATDLLQRQVEVIVVDSTPGVRAVKDATSSVPIVMAVIGDPVGSGIVTSLGHPGENVTGFSVMAAVLSVKRLQLLKDAVPQATRVAVLWNPNTRWHPRAVEDLKAAASLLSMELAFVSARSPEEFNPAFAAVSRARAQAMCVLDDAQFVVHRRTLVNLASTARLPAIYGERQFVEEGGLMSYGANYAEHWRRAAGYVDKILKGAKPADLPVEQPNRFELVVNLKSARALGLAIPESVLLLTDEVVR
jgi:putative ABC transport system substrate-binding protein